MLKEIFNPIERKIHQYKTFGIKLVKNRINFICFDGNEFKVKCIKCNYHIKYNEKCFYGYINKDNVYKIRNISAHKICLKCGLEILTAITPGKLIKEMEKMAIC